MRARHEAGIPAAVTFPEPEFESRAGDGEAARALCLLSLSHDMAPVGPIRLLIKSSLFSRRVQTRIYLCTLTEVTLIQTSDPE